MSARVLDVKAGVRIAFQKYAFFLGWLTVVPTVYLVTGQLFGAIVGYSIGYAGMLIFHSFSPK